MVVGVGARPGSQTQSAEGLRCCSTPTPFSGCSSSPPVSSSILGSPVSLLEIQFLHEIGRLKVDRVALAEALAADPRFTIDDISLSVLIDSAVTVDWTRDPFDRLLVAHSLARRLEFCSADRMIRTHHRLLPEPLRPKQ